MELPHDYIIDKIYLHCRRPIYKRTQKAYNFECPVCKEGASAGRKRRGYYFEETQHFFCHNCSESWTPFKWLEKVEGLTYSQMISESSQYGNTISTVDRIKQPNEAKPSTPTLPNDCINLADKHQISYHKSEPIIQEALQYLTSRRLLSAKNRCKYFYVTLTDFRYMNRLIIPFFDETGQIVFYQARALHKEDEIYGKYISKTGGDKTVFGVDRIDPKLDYLFLCEGPIDAMFVKNGLGICGIHMTATQQEQLQKFCLYTKVWVLDNQMDNDDVVSKYRSIISEGERVFIWPEQYSQFKDLNELCMHHSIDQVSPKFIITNSYTGTEAMKHLESAIIHQLSKPLV